MNKRTEKKNLKVLINVFKGDIESVSGNTDMNISGVEYDSRKVRKGSLFVAVKGFMSDGHDYIEDALKNGAAAVLVSRDRVKDFINIPGSGTVILAAGNTRKALAAVSAAFFGFPASGIIMIGVTGTNGKTSITYMIESILKEHGLCPGVVGTVNYRWNDTQIRSSNTTPESRDLQEIFAGMIADGVNAIVIEVSSHALKLNRADCIDFDVAAFTNLTRDHLDFHHSFEDYFDSKKRLFHLLEKSGKTGKCAVINCDDEYGRKLLEGKADFSYPVFSYGMSAGADFKVNEESIKSSVNSIDYTVEKAGERFNIRLNVIGNFQVYNSLCACSVCRCLGIPVNTIEKGLAALNGIPGRFSPIRSEEGFTVIVDYAHTDDAVSKLLKSARELGPRRLLTLLGCGGDRDKTKRPIMGKTAVDNSDWVIFTSDNPRTEDPEAIIRDMVKGLNEDNFETITDRETAIKKAVSMAEKDDIVVIAGKGHEDYQDTGGKKIHFDDHEIAEKYIAERVNH
ncbi:MAG: UDP-N-acetylmuramoyl-L-alanyl-D-glutamate--2,6-diaminopimelate ligase [Spirochaetes bacterium]|nr:UDP-N-acetylmuramoyl-L-alanyl-D-glutamate--2,6-diaminopimelate ligase [Spirochaetota bacterium]